jgi:hypothetical protein
MLKPTFLVLAPLLVLITLASPVQAELPCTLVMEKNAASLETVRTPEPTARVSLAGVLETVPARGAAPVRLGTLQTELVVALSPDARRPTVRGQAVAMLASDSGAALWLPGATADVSCGSRDCAEVDVTLTLAGPLVGALAGGLPTTLTLSLQMRHGTRGWVVVNAPGSASGVVQVLESMTDGGNTDLRSDTSNPVALMVSPEQVVAFLESTTEGGLMDLRGTVADPVPALETLREAVVAFLETTTEGGMTDQRGTSTDPALVPGWDLVTGFMESTTDGGLTD